jgi:hypothetical protein
VGFHEKRQPSISEGVEGCDEWCGVVVVVDAVGDEFVEGSDEEDVWLVLVDESVDFSEG